jgi:nitrate reductase gamma subunit
MILGAFTLAILVALLVRRLLHPVLRRISTFDDYLSVVLVILPLVTGFLSYSHVSPFSLRYETMLAVHLLSVEALLVWFPFGKLMHLFFAFPSRYQVGAAMERKGVEA